MVMAPNYGSGNCAARLIETAKRANLDRTPFVQDWIMAASVSPSDNVTQGAEKFLALRAAQAELLGVPFYSVEDVPGQHNVDGPPIGLGHDLQSGLSVVKGANDFTRQVAIFGATGTGKSYLQNLIHLQLAAKGYKLFIVDKDKTENRILAQQIGATIVNIVTDWPCNPFEVPPGLTPHEAIAIVADCMALSFGWLVASHSLFIDVVHELFVERGMFEGAKSYPTLRDIRNRLASKKFHPSSRAGGYIQTILNRKDAMLREIPTNYDFTKGIPIERLANQHIVLEVAGLSDYHARFRVLHFLYTLFRIRQKQGGSDGKLLNVAGIDEASSWFAPKIVNDQVGAGLLDKLVSQSRSSGLGFIFASQGVSDIDPTILKNSETKIIMRLGDGQCSDRIAKSISLSREQRDYIPRLGIGEAICSLPPQEPMLIRIPNLYGERT